MSKTAADAKLENFADLLAESFAEDANIEGSVVRGQVIEVADDHVTIDVGLKSEGRVPLREFAAPGQDAEIKAGDSVEVYVERMGTVTAQPCSSGKARRKGLDPFENVFEAQERVTGVIFGRVKVASPLIYRCLHFCQAVRLISGQSTILAPFKAPTTFQILKSTEGAETLLYLEELPEESRAEARSELVSNLQEGQILQGVVKNITDYGAFVDLGGVDGLLHVTDIAWKRINHPSESLHVGQTVDVQVIRFNAETQRISLGMKQLLSDHGQTQQKSLQLHKLSGRVTNATDYGAFIELDEGVEGLVHVSEMSWTKKNVHPGKIVSTSQQIKVMPSMSIY